MTFDIARVERRTTLPSADGTIVVQASQGFRSRPEAYVPFGCPPHFAEVILAELRGDKPAVERAWENVHAIETRSLPARVGPRSKVRRSHVSGHATVTKIFERKEDHNVIRRRKALLEFLMD